VNTVAEGFFVDKFAKVFKNVNGLLVFHNVEGVLTLEVHYLVFWVVHQSVDREVIGLKPGDVSDSIFGDISGY